MNLTWSVFLLSSAGLHAQQPALQSKDTAVRAKAAPPLVFEGVTVVDVYGGQLLPDRTVVIIGNRVRAIGAHRRMRLPQGAHVVDARGKYLIPGLWDMHVHVWDHPSWYPLLVANGVVGVRDMHTPYFKSLLEWRREIAASTRVGPRIIATSSFLSVQAGGDPDGLDVHTPEEARRAVDSLKAAGVDFIKYSDTTTRDVYFAIAAEARRIGIPFVGHLPVQVTELEASDSGQRSIEHLNELRGPCSRMDSVAEKGCAALAARFVKNGTWVTPTIRILDYLSRTMKFASPEHWQAMTRMMHRVGIPMLAGTDLFDYGLLGLDLAPRPGASLHEELASLVEAGLRPLDALRMATLNPAQFFNATDSLGTVEQGKLADLVLLDADPLTDINNTTKIRAVVANGRYFDRAELDVLIANRE